MHGRNICEEEKLAGKEKFKRVRCVIVKDNHTLPPIFSPQNSVLSDHVFNICVLCFSTYSIDTAESCTVTCSIFCSKQILISRGGF